MTDGDAQDRSDISENAQNLRDSGVKILAVGVGDQVKESQLNEMATDPDSENVFTVENFDSLGKIVKMIKDKACPGESNERS